VHCVGVYHLVKWKKKARWNIEIYHPTVLDPKTSGNNFRSNRKQYGKRACMGLCHYVRMEYGEFMTERCCALHNNLNIIIHIPYIQHTIHIIQTTMHLELTYIQVFRPAHSHALTTKCSPAQCMAHYWSILRSKTTMDIWIQDAQTKVKYSPTQSLFVDFVQRLKIIFKKALCFGSRLWFRLQVKKDRTGGSLRAILSPREMQWKLLT